MNFPKIEFNSILSQLDLNNFITKWNVIFVQFRITKFASNIMMKSIGETQINSTSKREWNKDLHL
jgi:hypothetical protein